MLVSHFDTYGNGMKPIYKPKHNSQGMPYISPPHQLSKYPFSQGRFGFHSEPKSRRMEAQYLQGEVRWTPTPKVILVHHIIPNNSAQYCSTQLCLCEKLWSGHKTAALPPEGGAYEYLWSKIVRILLGMTVQRGICNCVANVFISLRTTSSAVPQ